MFLITRPSHDVTTHYISAWSKEIIDFATTKNKKVIDLSNEKAVKSTVLSFFKKMPIKLVMFNGHGDESTIMGHNNQPIISSPENVGLLKSKIVYCRSCRSAQKLGPDSIISGATAFIGYDDDFIFLYDDQHASRPLNDTIAGKFLKPTNTLLFSLLKGNSVDVSYKRSQEEYNKHIEELLASDSTAEDMSSLRFLLWDKQHQIYHGDGQATY